MNNIPSIKPRQIVSYMCLPGIIPRFREFGRNGFGWLAYLMAYLYACVRLLPENHPYLQPGHIGRFGVRHVITEAANRLVLKKENIDQIVMFFVLLIGFIVLVMQFVLLFFGLVIQPAFAQNFEGFFATPSPENDIAFMLLDKVFGVPDLYGSQFNPGEGNIPPFNAALHALFHYYSMAILIVAVLVFLYYLFVVVAETAQTGTPFGRRFSHIYAPLRLVIAVGLLVPVNYGLNSAQYITLFAAKFGSGLATNGWIMFNQAIEDTAQNRAPGGPDEALLARPNIPDGGHLAGFISIVKACSMAYPRVYESLPYATEAKQITPDIQPYLVRNTEHRRATTGDCVFGAGGGGSGGGDYCGALEFYDNRDIRIRFGHHDSEVYTNHTGHVAPLCGEITIHVSDVTLSGPQYIQQEYYNMVLELWESDTFESIAETAIQKDIQSLGGCRHGPCPALEGDDAKRGPVNEIQEKVHSTVTRARDEMISREEFALPDELIERGWAGAAIWYNRIAMWNGALFSATFKLPTASRMPRVMEDVERERRIHDQNVNSLNRYEPYTSSRQSVNLSAKDRELAVMMNGLYLYWQTDGPSPGTANRTTGNAFIDLINSMFGLGGLLELRYNVDIHPLAQMVGAGKSIIESSITNLMVGLAFSVGGGMTAATEPHIGSALNSISTIFVSMTAIGLTAGFILYYVLPFMPFMYFFFAVGNWLKSIFEAMVGVPLWALAHLRIDGHGLPGDKAMNGYFLIFEIFARPILTLFGLIASLLVFTAMIRGLQEIFPLLISNITGFEGNSEDVVEDAKFLIYRRSAVDEFFYTIIYTIIAYLIATSCFKLIDQIPNSIMRWMGAGVQTFSDQAGDPAQGLVQYAAFGGFGITKQFTGALQDGAKTIGTVPGSLLASRLGPGQTTVTGSTRGGTGGATP